MRLSCFARASARSVLRFARTRICAQRRFTPLSLFSLSLSLSLSLSSLSSLFSRPGRAGRAAVACSELKRAGRLWKTRSRSGNKAQTYENRPNGRVLSLSEARSAQRHQPSVRKHKSPTARRRRRASPSTRFSHHLPTSPWSAVGQPARLTRGEVQHGHAHGHAGLYLIQDHALRPIGDLFGDLDAAVHWPGVHHQRIGLGER
jgi:hypothetical protein